MSEDTLSYLAVQGVSFTAEGPATNEQNATAFWQFNTPFRGNQMPEIDFLIVFPSFALWSSQDMTPLVHKMGEHKLILIFTDLDSANTFVERSELPCTVSRFPDATELREFLSCFSETDMVTFDPVDIKLGIISTYKVGQVLNGIDVA